MSRLRDEAIKAAEDKKEEEKKREEEEREKKPGKDGIRVRLKIFTILLYSFLNCCRLQMLQNRLTVQKTSDSVKQLMFERDLELEMLRRKKHYQTSASGLSFFFLFFFFFLFLSLRRKKQYTISASGLSSFFTFMSRAQICSKIAS